MQITIHQAKGLEFPTVFIPRFNEGTMPLDNRMSEGAGSESGQPQDSARHVQEERRLAFVALSRAKSQLFVSWVTKSRFGEPLLPSRFIEEIPSNLLTQSAAAAPSLTPAIAFPQCSVPLPRMNMPLPHSSLTSGSTPLSLLCLQLQRHRDLWARSVRPLICSLSRQVPLPRVFQVNTAFSVDASVSCHPPVAPKAAVAFRCQVWKSLGIAFTIHSCHHIAFFAQLYAVRQERTAYAMCMHSEGAIPWNSRELFELVTEPEAVL